MGANSPCNGQRSTVALVKTVVAMSWCSNSLSTWFIRFCIEICQRHHNHECQNFKFFSTLLDCLFSYFLLFFLNLRWRGERKQGWQRGWRLCWQRDLARMLWKVKFIFYQFCFRFAIFLGKKQDELVAMLEAEEDFQSSQTLLEERLALKGARLVFLPKFHPEFNPIECVYRYISSIFCLSAVIDMTFIFSRDVSRFCRDRNIVGNSAGFLERVLTADEVVRPEQCQKYFLSCQRCLKNNIVN